MARHSRSKPRERAWRLHPYCNLALAAALVACGSAPIPTVAPLVQLSQTSLTFSGMAGGPDPGAQVVGVANAGGGTLSLPTTSVNYTSGSSWLAATPSGSAAPYALTIQPSTAGLPAGTYTASVTVLSPGAGNSPVTLAVTLTLQASAFPVLQLSPTSLAFTATAGGSTPPSQAVTVGNGGTGTLAPPAASVGYASGSGWLTATVSGSAAPYTVTVQPDASGLAAGTYGATVSVASAGASNTPQSFPVTLTVQAAPVPPAIQLSPTDLAFTGKAGSSDLGAKSITVSNAGGGTLSVPTITYGTDSGWVTVTPSGSSAPYTAIVQPNIAALGPGTHVATVSIACPGAPNSPQTLVVTLSLSPPTGTVDDFTVPTGTSMPYGITAGPDGNVWFCEGSARQIGRITPGGTITEFGPLAGNPTDIVAGPDGALWFTEYQRIGRISTSGTITELVVPHGRSALSLAAGSDGALWFIDFESQSNACWIGRVTTSGDFSEFQVSPWGGSTGKSIVAGPDGNLWFIGDQRIARITTGGTLTEFPVPGSTISSIAAGPDGNVWFIEQTAQGASIGRMSAGGAVAHFKLSSGTFPLAIAAGPDGNVWFTAFPSDDTHNAICRITPSGTITEFDAPGGQDGHAPYLVAGPPADGHLWFSETYGNRIGRFTP